jgi:hypothetical protein
MTQGTFSWERRRLAGNTIRAESSMPVQYNSTEGLGYARRGRFAQANIPAGTYLVEIGFIDQPQLMSKRITIAENETATVKFQVKAAGSIERSRPGGMKTAGIRTEIE